MRTDRVWALTRLFVSRLVRQLGAVAGAVIVLAALDVARHGVRPGSLLAWCLGGAMMIPAMQGVLVVRDKMNGALRFLASLPIEGREHAAARVFVAALLALPAAVLTIVGMRVNEPALTAFQDVSIGIGAFVGLTVLSIMFTALQLRTKIGEGIRTTMLLFVAVVVLGRVTSSALSGDRLAAFRGALFSVQGFAVASLIVCLTLALAAWWAVRTIARISESYEGEGAAVA